MTQQAIPLFVCLFIACFFKGYARHLLLSRLSRHEKEDGEKMYQKVAHVSPLAVGIDKA
jgi:hypothetical protein